MTYRPFLLIIATLTLQNCAVAPETPPVSMTPDAVITAQSPTVESTAQSQEQASKAAPMPEPVLSQTTNSETDSAALAENPTNKQSTDESVAALSEPATQSAGTEQPQTDIASDGSQVATEAEQQQEILENIAQNNDLNSDLNNDQSNDLWDRIRRGFRLDHNHPGVQPDLRWFSANQAYLDRVAERAEPFLHYIVTETEQRQMPLEIALLPVVESAFQAFAYSHGRAAGIWQFIPGTGRIFGLRQNWWYDGRRDVWASTRAALKYLNALYKEFGDWELALAAYNSGAGTVRKAIRKNLRKGRATDFWSLRRNLPVETRGYVPKLLAIAALVADPEQHGVELTSIADSPYLAHVELEAQLDLALAAELAEMSVEEVYELNPAYNRWATDPNHKSFLLIPLEKEAEFKQRLADLPPEQRIGWQRHRIRRGETIGQIAARYNTTASVIRKVNKLRGNTIRQGKNLIIPVAMRDASAYTQTKDKRKRRIQNTERKGRFKQTYTVKTGDSFWTISRKFHVGMRQLARWNGMASRDKLSVGQTLVIWTKRNSKKLTSVDTSRMVKPPGAQTKRWIRYHVRRGDSLARIAQRFRITVKQIKNWNKKLNQTTYLQPGQKIKLYVDVTRQSV